MNKLKLASLFGVVAAPMLLLSAPVQAQQSSVGWYLGGGIGKSQNKFDTGDFSLGLAAVAETKDETDTGYKLFGGYRFSRNWGLEFGYADLGKFSYAYSGGPAVGSAKLDYKVNAWTIAGTGTLPLTDAFSLQGRLGAAATRAKATLASSSGAVGAALTAGGFSTGTSGKKSRTNLLWGLGAQYDFDPRFGLRLDYDNYGRVGDTDNTGRAKNNLWSINAVVRF